MVHHIENNQINNEVLKNDKLIIIDFFATWCGPCQMIAPVLEEISKTYSDEVEIFKVDIDENQEVAMRYSIMSVPTIIFFKDGKEIERHVGYLNVAELENIIKDLI